MTLASDARMAQDWIFEGGDDDENERTTSTRTDEIIRELDEDNFQSEDEPERKLNPAISMTKFLRNTKVFSLPKHPCVSI